jgi:hypothetical protein
MVRIGMACTLLVYQCYCSYEFHEHVISDGVHGHVKEREREREREYLIGLDWTGPAGVFYFILFYFIPPPPIIQGEYLSINLQTSLD